MAPAEDDISIEEKRVYAGTSGRTDVFLATETGLVRVALSADKIGAFTLVGETQPIADVTVYQPQPDRDFLAVATADGLRVGPAGDPPTPTAVTPGTPVAVAGGDDALCVASTDHTLWRVAADADGRPSEATRVGQTAAVRAIDPPLVATEDGVVRFEMGGPEGSHSVTSVGLDDVRDVAAGDSLPLAATATGVYWLGNGWMAALEGVATAIAADGEGHAMAVVDDELLVRDADATEWDAHAWTRQTLPVTGVPAVVGYGPGCALTCTADGTLCVDAGDGWRHQALGVRGVSGLSVSVNPSR